MPELLLEEEESNILLACGYGISAGLFVLYFVWEKAPCHWSRRFESAFLRLVLGIVYVTGILWSETRIWPAGANLGGVFKVRHIMRLILLDHILFRFVEAGMHPKFFEKPSARGAAQTADLRPSFRAERNARELDDTLQEIMEYRSGAGMSGVMLRMAAEPLLFLFMMVEDILYASEDLREALLYPLLVLNILVPAVVILKDFREFWAVQRKMTKIYHVVANLVAHGDKELLSQVLARISAGTFVEIASFSTVLLLTDASIPGSAFSQGILSTTSKAILIEGMQQRGLRGIFGDQASHLMMSCKGKKLTKLKNLIDGSGSYQNLYKLVFEDLGTNNRTAVLEHIEAEAAGVREEVNAAVGVKVMSDVDDTLYSSGGHFPAGCDRRFPPHVLYPGFLRLLEALDKGFDPTYPSCNLAFLSARPHIYKDLAEEKSYKLFAQLVADGHMHSFPTLLPGKLVQGVWAFLTYACSGTRAWQPVGNLKFRTFMNFRRLYREYDFVFCGDNGQGDLLAGQRMLEPGTSLAGHGKVLCVLIQEVMEDSRALARDPRGERRDREAWRGKLQQQGLVLHRNYVQAAVALHRMSPTLITGEDIRAVAGAAIEDFDKARIMYDDWQNWQEWADGFAKDLEEAEKLCPESSHAFPKLRPATEILARWRRENSIGPRVRIHIIGARGLRKADAGGLSDPYCTCGIVGKNIKVKTPVINNTLDPVWNFESHMTGCAPKDSLLFTVWDRDIGSRDDSLGSTTLHGIDFKNGYEGELELEGAGKGIKAFLRVKVVAIEEEDA